MQDIEKINKITLINALGKGEVEVSITSGSTISLHKTGVFLKAAIRSFGVIRQLLASISRASKGKLRESVLDPFTGGVL